MHGPRPLIPELVRLLVIRLEQKLLNFSYLKNVIPSLGIEPETPEVRSEYTTATPPLIPVRNMNNVYY